MNAEGRLRRDQFPTRQTYLEAVRALRELGLVPPGNYTCPSMTPEERKQARRTYYRWLRRQQRPGYNSACAKRYYEKRKRAEAGEVRFGLDVFSFAFS